MTLDRRRFLKASGAAMTAFGSLACGADIIFAESVLDLGGELNIVLPFEVEEFKSIPEKRVLVVDDNLIGTRPEHVARAKALFQAMIQAKLFAGCGSGTCVVRDH